MEACLVVVAVAALVSWYSNRGRGFSSLVSSHSDRNSPSLRLVPSFLFPILELLHVGYTRSWIEKLKCWMLPVLTSLTVL